MFGIDIKNDEDFILLKSTILEMKDSLTRIEQINTEQLETSKRIEKLIEENKNK